MTFLLGTACLVGAALLLWIGRPRGGHASPLLAAKYVEGTYALAITMLVGLGLASLFGAMAGLAGG